MKISCIGMVEKRRSKNIRFLNFIMQDYSDEWHLAFTIIELTNMSTLVGQPYGK